MDILEKQVTVCFERTTNSVRIDPAEVRVGNREWVRWSFEGLRETEFGFISFAPPLSRLGPFSSLRSFTNSAVLGKGSKGTAVGNAYGYRALVLDLSDPSPKATGVGMVVTTATEENTAPEIVVTFCDGNPPQLKVVPDPVGLNTGDTAIWRFVNLPSNAFACFRFETEDAGNHPELGPFIAFSARHLEDTAAFEASGSGFAAILPEFREHFAYHIEIRDWAGRRLASHDPLIDNLGPPPGPPGGKE